MATSQPIGAGRSTAGPRTLRSLLRLVRARARDLLAGSPGRLRLVALIGALGALLVALGGGLALRAQADAAQTARTASAHLVLVQGVRTSVVRADANATNAFLRGGLEPVGQRREYLASMTSAAWDLALAARTGTGDGAAYARANDGLTRYAGFIETARTDNRHGLPVGASYLRMGSRQLRSDVLPELSELAAADTARISAAYNSFRRSALIFAATALLGLGLLGTAQVRLARITRSVFTVPAALTGGVFAVAVFATGIVCGLAVAGADAVRTGASAETNALALARAAAFDAKATESLILIGRGSYAEGESAWQSSLNLARAQASHDPSVVVALDKYAREHAEIRRLDTGGQWQAAVKRAVSDSAGSANASFAAFDTASAALLSSNSRAALGGLADARDPLPFGAIGVSLASLIALGGIWRGVARRLDEYR
jgi:hypothetical protein